MGISRPSRVAEHLEAARADVLAFTAFPRRCGGRSGPTGGRRYLGLEVLARCRLRPVDDTGETTEEVTIRHSAPDQT